MRRLALVFLSACLLHAASIRGTVVEQQSGKPLSRVLLKLIPLPGVSATLLTTRSTAIGGFEFTGIPAGSYMLSASRKEYITVQYGQKQWNSAGLPLVLDDAAALFLPIRMPRYSAITGRVMDENDVGIPYQPVVAYKNLQPPELAGRGTADEQGRYRIFGLEPGSYLVRSAPWQDDTIDYIPTFAKETERAEQARTVEAIVDQDVDRVDIKPIRGKLLEVSGVVSPSLPIQVKLTFATDMGRETVETAGSFRFAPVPPGVYEMYAEGIGYADCPVLGAWMEVDLRRPHPVNMTVPCMGTTMVSIATRGGQQLDPAPFHILARRVDRAGLGEIQEMQTGRRGALLLPGRWQIMLKTPPNYYVAEMMANWAQQARHRADGWNEVTITRPGYIRFIVSTGPGGLHGQVTGLSHEAVAGAPVFLEPVDPISGKRTGDLIGAITDVRGQYHFYGLAPGPYRVVATFEYQAPDADTMSSWGKSITISENSDKDFPLDLHVL